MPPDENFVRDFTDLCTGSEIPPTFATWSGISGVSAALGRRCWIDMGFFTVFPNMYLVLVAGSGEMRKSTSVSLVERIIRALKPPPNLISQKMSPEALIDTLSKGDAVGNQLISPTSNGFIILDELATFLNKNVYEAGLGAILTPLYDGKPVEYKTMLRGVQKIENPLLGILAAATYDWLANCIPETAIGGGVMSRFLLVYEQRVPKRVSRPIWDEEKVLLQEHCVNTLQRISMLEGEFTLTQEAGEYFDYEYEHFTDTAEGKSLYADKNTRGYTTRRFVHLLKLGMLLSASESANKTIDKRHLLAGLGLLRQSEVALPKLYSIITSTEQGNLLSTVLNLIRSQGCLTKSELTRAVANKVGVREVLGIIETLVAQGVVLEQIDGKASIYRWVGEDVVGGGPS